MKTILRIAGILACVAASRLKRILRIAGTLACIAVFVLNLQNAADNYGIKAGKAHIEVLAKSGSSGSGSGPNCYDSYVVEDLLDFYYIFWYICEEGSTAPTCIDGVSVWYNDYGVWKHDFRIFEILYCK